MVSRKGQAIRFHESATRPMGRATEGVRGMSLRQSDEVIAASLAENDADVLVVTRNGFGKRTPIRDYPVKGRGGLGVQTVKLTEARGELAGALVVRDGYQIMLMSTGGTVIKVPVEDVKRLGRSTQGVIVMRTRDGEEVSTLAPVVDQPDVPEVGQGEDGGVGQGEDEAAEAPAEAADEAPVEAEAVAEPGADE
jgi:DNA gyrase subunit A